MIPYGNTYTKIEGIIREMEPTRAIVEFPCSQRKIPIPNRFIHNNNIKSGSQIRELLIETWFLKKNRIIPLFDHSSEKFNLPY